LLVLDNADEPAQWGPFVPASIGGHLLVTTRASDLSGLGLGFAHGLLVDPLTPEDSVRLLLHRAGLLALEADCDQVGVQDRALALQICQELGHLPLALDQAGAYFKATGCGLASYQQIYQQHRSHLLRERRGQDHPEPVATTWSLSFEQVEQKNPAAADLLRVCAFLAPDAIPETIITKGASHLGPYLASVGTDAYLLNQPIEVLRAYSLIHREVSRETGNMFSVHRLVQAVLQDTLDEQSKKQWAERVVHAINAAFPEVEHQNWLQCDQLVPHAKVGAELIRTYDIAYFEALRLLHQTGFYLSERARYQEAEVLLKQALLFIEQEVRVELPNTASCLNNLAILYEWQGKYEEAEPLYQRALTICEGLLGSDHSDTVNILNNLAAFYERLGKHSQAELLLVRAFAICEQKLGDAHPETASCLNNLASLYCDQGKYAEAEPLYQQVLAMREQQLGGKHPETAVSLSNLALLYYDQGKYTQAEPLLVRVLEVREQTLGGEHPATAVSFNNLAGLYRLWGQYSRRASTFPTSL
jgi:tetratricopeptide (TPR) repeat protein